MLPRRAFAHPPARLAADSAHLHRYRLHRYQPPLIRRHSLAQTIGDGLNIDHSAVVVNHRPYSGSLPPLCSIPADTRLFSRDSHNLQDNLPLPHPLGGTGKKGTFERRESVEAYVIYGVSYALQKDYASPMLSIYVDNENEIHEVMMRSVMVE